jgi:hypothetical protein
MKKEICLEDKERRLVEKLAMDYAKACVLQARGFVDALVRVSHQRNWSAQQQFEAGNLAEEVFNDIAKIGIEIDWSK